MIYPVFHCNGSIKTKIEREMIAQGENMALVKAFVLLNIKLLLQDKISFLWSISMPTIMLLIQKNSIAHQPHILGFWWTYIAVCSFLFGIGIYALRLRESGVLRVVFSINKAPMYFFLGLLGTQIVFAFTVLVVFNLIACLLFHFNFFVLLWQSIIVMLCCLPVAFAGYNLTGINRLHANSTHTLASIIVFIAFLLMATNKEFNILWKLHQMFVNNTGQTFLFYILGSIIIILISLPAIIRFKCISAERR
jgi:ABC-2 type transport system permease protein